MSQAAVLASLPPCPRRTCSAQLPVSTAPPHTHTQTHTHTCAHTHTHTCAHTHTHTHTYTRHSHDIQTLTPNLGQLVRCGTNLASTDQGRLVCPCTGCCTAPTSPLSAGKGRAGGLGQNCKPIKFTSTIGGCVHTHFLRMQTH